MARSSLVHGVYENHLHFFYTARKIIKNKEIDYRPVEKLLFHVAKDLFDFSNNHKDSIAEKCLRMPTSVFTYRLVACKTIEDVHELLSTIPSIMATYNDLFTKDIEEMTSSLDVCSKYLKTEALGYLESRRDPEYFIYWDDYYGKYRNLSEEYLGLKTSIFSSSGVYFLYDNLQNLIYIGKSYTLWKRILSSCKERKAIYCRYAIINNKSDTDIYEMYYISKYKPVANGTGKHNDSPSMVLPELKFSPLTLVYVLSDEKPSLMVINQ